MGAPFAMQLVTPRAADKVELATVLWLPKFVLSGRSLVARLLISNGSSITRGLAETTRKEKRATKRMWRTLGYCIATDRDNRPTGEKGTYASNESEDKDSYRKIKISHIQESAFGFFETWLSRKGKLHHTTSRAWRSRGYHVWDSHQNCLHVAHRLRAPEGWLGSFSNIRQLSHGLVNVYHGSCEIGALGKCGHGTR